MYCKSTSIHMQQHFARLARSCLNCSSLPFSSSISLVLFKIIWRLGWEKNCHEPVYQLWNEIVGKKGWNTVSYSHCGLLYHLYSTITYWTGDQELSHFVPEVGEPVVIQGQAPGLSEKPVNASQIHINACTAWNSHCVEESQNQ